MSVSVPSYVKKYLRMTPVVAKIFDDLEEYKNFIRVQYPFVPFNEADMYNYKSPLWQKFERKRARKVKLATGS